MNIVVVLAFLVATCCNGILLGIFKQLLILNNFIQF